MEQYFRDKDALFRSMRIGAVELHPGLDAMLHAQNKNRATMNMDEMEAAVRQWSMKAHAPATPAAGASQITNNLTNQQICACINDYQKTIVPRVALDNCRKAEGANCLRVEVQVVETFKI